MADAETNSPATGDDSPPQPTDTDARASESAGGEAAIDEGTFEILRRRLQQQAEALSRAAEALNQQRIELFGGSELAVIGSVRIRTENNCVPRDIAQVGDEQGDQLLFGYNVFIGLKKQTEVHDVLSCHRFEEGEPEGAGDAKPVFHFHPVQGEVLEDARFRADFRELYEYYKNTRLLQLRNIDGKLLAVFQTGASARDYKVLRWQLDAEGRARYIDNRGERDHTFAPPHDFEWTVTTRDDHVQGRHPHVDVLGKVFVEAVGGDLTIKVEDNTEDGLGIYREPVNDPDQALDDGEVHYAELGSLILLRVLPFREDTWRYFVFNTRTQQVDRIDAIGLACQQLPEDHGIIFPGGYYLQSGETKIYEQDQGQSLSDLEFVKRIRAPNGEDALYIFHHRETGASLLLPYNLIRKQVQTPIRCHGYTVFSSGRLVIFRAESDEPTRVHTMQIWQTPFCTEEFAARGAAESAGTFLEQVGNAELVRGVAELLTLVRAAHSEEPPEGHYSDLVKACGTALDRYHWLGEDEVRAAIVKRQPALERGLQQLVGQLRATAELVVDEYEKVQSLRRKAEGALREAQDQVAVLRREVRPQAFSDAQQFVRGLVRLRSGRGHLISLRELRYIDRERLDALEQEVVEQTDALAAATADFLQGQGALAPFRTDIEEIEQSTAQVRTVAEASPLAEDLGELESGIRLLADVASNLEIDDATVRTAILEEISEVLGGLNRARALLDRRRRELRSREATGEFGVEFKLFSQAVTSAIHLASTPEECDEALGRLMVQLEEIEGRYSDFDDFLAQLVLKREEVYEALSAKKQQLLDERQRRAEQILSASRRILDSVRRRAASIAEQDALNAFFASDPMVAKLRDQSARLRELGDVVKADDLESQVSSARQEAARSLRDRSEIFERSDSGAELLRFGRHRFSVNTQPLDLTLVPREDRLDLHLTGTDYYEPAHSPELEARREFWTENLISESKDLYRGEYLAVSILRAAQTDHASGHQRDNDAEQAAAAEDAAVAAEGSDAEDSPRSDASPPDRGPSLDSLHAALEADELLAVVREASAERYDEGYERGVHDADAATILAELLHLYSAAELLAAPPAERALAMLFWGGSTAEQRDDLARRVANAQRLRRTLGSEHGVRRLVGDLSPALGEFAQRLPSLMEAQRVDIHRAALYLVDEVGEHSPRFVVSAEALELDEQLSRSLRDHQSAVQVQDAVAQLPDLTGRYELLESWLLGLLDTMDAHDSRRLRRQVPFVAALRLLGNEVETRKSHASLRAVAKPMLGDHPRIRGGELIVQLDDLLQRYDRFQTERVPAFHAFQQRRHQLIEERREQLRLEEFKPRVLSSFVRNQLLDQVYLPLIGDNLAKQIGVAGEGKRTDLMGLLLLISPPGYGKTTLMEYVASRLGLVFLKVNGPALGHSVTSLDPADAPNATARQEVEKINLGFEMGNNVLLYLDDIQHTSSELLQKFISLCDGQRRVEGVWQGRTRTYDLRGKRFCVCMAGNPYTESGERFQIPDMLANRADVYNLGDILEGRDDLFALSYIENSLTSNPVLAPLAGRSPQDVRTLVRMARGEAVPSDQLEYPYEGVELEEIRSVLQRLLRVQSVLLAINQLYITSASQDDRYRREPPFQLQGSYRNMNKLAEKVVAVMNAEELEALLDDHYLGESQTLTQGAEWNLLRLRELRDVLTPEERQRIAQIRELFARNRAMGGEEDDPVVRLVGTLGLLSEGLRSIEASIGQAASAAEQRALSSAEASGAQLEVRGLGTELGEGLRTALAAALQESLDNSLRPAVSLLAEALVKGQSASAAAAVPSTPAISDQSLELATDKLGKHLAAMARVIQGTGAALSERASTPAAAAPGSSVQVVQTLGSGVHEVLDDLGSQTSEQLLELVRGISRWANRQDGELDPRLRLLVDRTLTQLDRFKDLVNTLKRLDTGHLDPGHHDTGHRAGDAEKPPSVPPPPPAKAKQDS